MRQEERFDDILNECLDRILKGETVEQCLLSYPEQSKELEPLLRTAKAARVISSMQPRPEFKAEARRQFQAAMIEMKVNQTERKAQAGHRWQWRWQSGWAIGLIVVVIVVLGGGGTVAAAQNSMPDSGLYSIKLATEKVQLSLASGEIAKTELNAKFADRRTDEIIYIAEKGDAQEVQIIASRLNTNLSNIAELAAGNAQFRSESTGEPAPLMAPQPMEMSKNAAPPQMNTSTDWSAMATPDIAAANAPPEQILQDTTASGAGAAATPEPNAEARFAAPAAAPQAAQTAEPAPEVTVNAPVSALQNSNNTANKTLTKYEKLRAIIQENYEKRELKLEEALNNVSPEVRPAIRQAIAKSDLEYERALKNLEETENAEDAQN
jgi:hypothetical protein